MFFTALPFLISNSVVVVFWSALWIWWINDYAWYPRGTELEMLHMAFTSIFLYKVFFWLVLTNLIVLAITHMKKKKYKIAGNILFLAILFYALVGLYTNKKCASHWYCVFLNQSVPEESITRPILEAGYSIGPILTEAIMDKDLKFRGYAIIGLTEIKYSPTIEIIGGILLDKTENEIFRKIVYYHLHSFNTKETRKILEDFRRQTVDTLDKEVIRDENGHDIFL